MMWHFAPQNSALASVGGWSPPAISLFERAGLAPIPRRHWPTAGVRCDFATSAAALLGGRPGASLDSPPGADRVQSRQNSLNPGAIVKWDHATMAWWNLGFKSPWLQ